MADEERKVVDYPERDVKDLIEEDKRPFGLRRILTTVFGGFRCVYDEEESIWINKFLYPVQIILYLLIPSIVLMSIALFTDMTQALIFSGIASLVIAALL